MHPLRIVLCVHHPKSGLHASFLLQLPPCSTQYYCCVTDVFVFFLGLIITEFGCYSFSFYSLYCFHFLKCLVIWAIYSYVIIILMLSRRPVLIDRTWNLVCLILRCLEDKLAFSLRSPLSHYL